MFLEEARNAEFYYTDLTALGETERKRLLEVLQIVVAVREKAGPGSFHSPEFFPAYMDRLHALRELLER